MNFLNNLECSECGKIFDASKIQTICHDCDEPLLARYNLDKIKESVNKEDIESRYPNMWRYREFLPVLRDENIVSLGEGFTPIIRLRRLGKQLGIDRLYLKDEGLSPTGTFKSRGLCMGISKAKELGIKKIAIPSAGNAAGALSAYGAKADMKVFIIMPKIAPDSCKIESYMMGANVYLIDGLLPECGKIIDKGKKKFGWFSISTTKEPYRLEGKKTMGFEIAEQFSWSLPDYIFYPTGGGTGLIGMWKAFDELKKIGWIDEEDLPKMISVQAEGCAPIVEAYDNREERCKEWKEPHTIADGIQVPKAFADKLILEAIYDSNGAAISVTDEEILEGSKELAEQGFFVCPEGSATLAGAKKMIDNENIDKDEEVLLYNTGTGLKYLNTFVENLDINIPVIKSIDDIDV
ncbi:MAG: threonine synthase [Thermoplasmatota archaeon]